MVKWSFLTSHSEIKGSKWITWMVHFIPLQYSNGEYSIEDQKHFPWLNRSQPPFLFLFFAWIFFIDAKSHANTEWQKRWNQSPSVSHWRACYWSALELRVLRNEQIARWYVPESKLPILGMGDLPPLIGNPYNGYINPYYWVDEFIPYYMERMGV